MQQTWPWAAGLVGKVYGANQVEAVSSILQWEPLSPLLPPHHPIRTTISAGCAARAQVGSQLPSKRRSTDPSHALTRPERGPA